MPQTPYAVYMQVRQGFTIVEIVIVMVIMTVLMTLGIASFVSSQGAARDSEREEDVASIARGIEARYLRGNQHITSVSSPASPQTIAAYSYPGINEMKHIFGEAETVFSPNQISGGYAAETLTGVSTQQLSPPNQTRTQLYYCDPTSCLTNSTQVTVDAYFYEPRDSSGSLCRTNACSEFYIFYKTEDGTVKHVRSKRRG